jgi:hypothetical protein
MSKKEARPKRSGQETDSKKLRKQRWPKDIEGDRFCMNTQPPIKSLTKF